MHSLEFVSLFSTAWKGGAGIQHGTWEAAAVPWLTWMPTSAQVPLELEGQVSAQVSSIMGEKCLKQHVFKVTASQMVLYSGHPNIFLVMEQGFGLRFTLRSQINVYHFL